MLTIAMLPNDFGASDARSGRKLVVKDSNIELKNPPICSIAVNYTGIASQCNAIFDANWTKPSGLLPI